MKINKPDIWWNYLTVSQDNPCQSCWSWYHKNAAKRNILLGRFWKYDQTYKHSCEEYWSTLYWYPKFVVVFNIQIACSDSFDEEFKKVRSLCKTKDSSINVGLTTCDCRNKTFFENWRNWFVPMKITHNIKPLKFCCYLTQSVSQ